METKLYEQLHDETHHAFTNSETHHVGSINCVNKNTKHAITLLGTYQYRSVCGAHSGVPHKLF